MSARLALGFFIGQLAKIEKKGKKKRFFTILHKKMTVRLPQKGNRIVYSGIV
jgi:hypothetical protein